MLLEDVRRIIVQMQMADEVAAGINSESRGHLAIQPPTIICFIVLACKRYIHRCYGYD
jgi:DNA-binding transcriptional LysR family regulator